MNCGEVREIIQLYMDNELEARDTLSVQKHLESCGGCFYLLETFLEQDRLLRDEARAEQVDSHLLREQILNIVRDSQPQSSVGRRNKLARWTGQPAWLRFAAIVVLALAAGLLLSKAGLLPSIGQNVLAAVASDHADHCSIDSKLPAITDADELNRLSRTYAKLDKTPDLSYFGYGGVRGRTCKVNGTPFLHLVYYSCDQQPVSVFLRLHSSTLPADDLSLVKEREYEVVSVFKSGVDLLVVSSIHSDKTTAITESIMAQL
ncbi:MAG TPA: anti-sigma factor [Blastocatellia bacterium]|nr:anti-sigma factor [Blastocatellia bacterium]